MAAPALNVAQGGLGSVSADNLNTFEQDCDTVAQLRTLVGVAGMQVFVRGLATAGDGGAGPFYWNTSSTASDNGVSVIVPTGGSTTGAWLRLGYLAGSGGPFMPLRYITGTALATATKSDGTIAWNSSTAAAKAQTIPAAGSVIAGFMLIIKDYYGSAATYNITITPVTGSINGGTNLVINTNGGLAWLQSDGLTNWVSLLPASLL